MRERQCQLRPRSDIEEAISLFADDVLRACTVHLHQQADREDAFQETFLRYAQHEDDFNDEGHRKAWLLRVAINICKDRHKRKSSKDASLDESVEGGASFAANEEADPVHEAAARSELLDALNSLEGKYRSVLYLSYYEGYHAAEIGEILGIPENTVYTNLSRGRKALKGVLMHGGAQ